jgi:hypothetical protein
MLLDLPKVLKLTARNPKSNQNTKHTFGCPNPTALNKAR